MGSADHNDIKVHVKRCHTAKIFRLCEEFNLIHAKTLNMALAVGLSTIDQDLRFAPKSRYLPKLTSEDRKDISPGGAK